MLSVPSLNLTQMEKPALVAEVNVADGHPRQSLTPSQREIVARFPELFYRSCREDFDELEARSQAAYLAAVGQRSVPVGTGRVLSCYSSSVAMSVLSRCLAATLSTVRLVNPTFDNIPDILRSWGLALVPVAEEELASGEWTEAAAEERECVFLTAPNNPTGWWLPEEGLEALATACAARGSILAIDASFRGFDERMQFDGYEVLDATGVDYVVIEDTGKLWPTSELKLGLLVLGPTTDLGIENALSDILLSVSPFVLALVEAFSEDGADGGLAELRRFVSSNRDRVRAALAGSERLRLEDPDSRASVARLRLDDGLSAREVWETLRARGVHTLPGARFHWADPEQGDCYLRIALSRDPDVLDRALAAIRSCVESGGD